MAAYVHLVGYSNSGKTTVMSGLIKIFKNRKYSIAAVKHASHGYNADLRGSDSWSFAQAGADRVVIAGPESVTFHEYYRPEYPLAEILDRIGDVDLVLVEGFKSEPGPKIEIYRQGISADRLAGIGPMLAVVSDVPLEGEIPNYSFQELEGLADYIVGNLM